MLADGGKMIGRAPVTVRGLSEFSLLKGLFGLLEKQVSSPVKIAGGNGGGRGLSEEPR